MHFVQWLGDTPWSIALHESDYAYAIVESVHVLTLCLFLGFAMMMDLRLAGLTMRQEPVSQVSGRLLPPITIAFVIMVISGALLFYAIERFRRTAPDVLLYQFTVDDPGTYVRPWPGEIPLRITDGPLYEYACHEGNYAMVDILSGAREEEKRVPKN